LLISDVDLLEAVEFFWTMRLPLLMILVRISPLRLYMLLKLERGFGRLHDLGLGGLMRGQRGSGPGVSSILVKSTLTLSSEDSSLI
jgi:hypothetical protein